MENNYIYIFRKNTFKMKLTFIIIMIMMSGYVRPAEKALLALTAHHWSTPRFSAESTALHYSNGSSDTV